MPPDEPITEHFNGPATRATYMKNRRRYEANLLLLSLAAADTTLPKIVDQINALLGSTEPPSADAPEASSCRSEPNHHTEAHQPISPVAPPPPVRAPNGRSRRARLAAVARIENAESARSGSGGEFGVCSAGPVVHSSPSCAQNASLTPDDTASPALPIKARKE